jgi:hypothetical protein
MNGVPMTNHILARILLVVAVVTLTTTVHAQVGPEWPRTWKPQKLWPPTPKRPAIWPPVEFDYPYKGKLTVTRVHKVLCRMGLRFFVRIVQNTSYRRLKCTDPDRLDRAANSSYQ